jgi:hypothetical protein
MRKRIREILECDDAVCVAVFLFVSSLACVWV